MAVAKLETLDQELLKLNPKSNPKRAPLDEELLKLSSSLTTELAEAAPRMSEPRLGQPVSSTRRLAKPAEDLRQVPVSSTTVPARRLAKQPISSTAAESHPRASTQAVQIQQPLRPVSHAVPTRSNSSTAVPKQGTLDEELSKLSASLSSELAESKQVTPARDPI